MPNFFLDVWHTVSRKPKRFFYHLKCTLLPSHRYHLIDLRETKTADNPHPYRFGWLDSDHKMVLALFKILCDFVEKEMPHGYYIPTEEEVAKDDGVDYEYAGFKRQRANYLEFIEIYNYWKVDRFILAQAHDEALIAWNDSHHAHKGDANPETKALWEALQVADQKEKDKLEEMLIRLIKIRGCLWT